MTPQVKQHLRQHAWTAFVFLSAGAIIVFLILTACTGCTLKILDNVRTSDLAEPMKEFSTAVSKTSDRVIESTERVANQLLAPSTQPAAIAEKISESLTKAAESISNGMSIAATQPAAVVGTIGDKMNDAAQSMGWAMVVTAAIPGIVNIAVVASLALLVAPTFRRIGLRSPEGATGPTNAHSGAPLSSSQEQA